MKERPILFSAPMVRALLSGDKTTPSPTERDAFDKWCKKDNPKYQPANDGISNRRDWLVWQAALSGAAVQPAKKATCQTCEALARTVMMDQVGRAA